MDSRGFLGLQQSHNPYRWWLPVAPHLCTGGGFLFGGCGLGAAISAIAAALGRSLLTVLLMKLNPLPAPERADEPSRDGLRGRSTGSTRTPSCPTITGVSARISAIGIA